VYEWLGFEAYDLIMNILKEVASDKTLSLDFFAYDLNEPDIVALLEQMGGRLRAVIDDSKDHKPATSAELQAAKRLGASAGFANVKRMHFKNLQHNKVLIVKRNRQPLKVLFGSTNFSFRGIYIQANNALVFYAPEAAALFEQAFEPPSTIPQDSPRTRSQPSGIWCRCRANRLRISVSPRTPTPICRSIRSVLLSIRRPRRCSSRLHFFTRTHRDRRGNPSID
jgi:phosphatidylserine/phosphatidylglycerophosphate/cardiolipin synthase-like enzyme